MQKIAVGRACNQNGGASYTRESPATNSPLQEADRKSQETAGWRSERGCRHVTCHTSLENQSQRQRILEAVNRGGQGSVWAVTPLQQQVIPWAEWWCSCYSLSEIRFIFIFTPTLFRVVCFRKVFRLIFCMHFLYPIWAIHVLCAMWHHRLFTLRRSTHCEAP